MATNLMDIGNILDEHFRLAPPLDLQNFPVSEAAKEYGNGISLGDGKTMEGVHGLENIQVIEKVGDYDEVRQISLKEWLENSIRQNSDPPVIASSLKLMLESGHLSYFEQGREFATHLSLDPETNKLKTTIINREAPPIVKPKLKFMQKVRRFFGKLPPNERIAYNDQLLAYELQKKSLAASKIRAAIAEGRVLTNDDGKGRVFSGAGGDAEDVVNYSNLRNVHANDAAELKIGPKQNGEKILAEMYPNGKPIGINTIEDHINARIAKQGAVDYVKIMKSRTYADVIADGGKGTSVAVSRALISVMSGKDNSGKSDALDALITSTACQVMCRKRGVASELVAKNQLFDQFARNLERYPIKGLKPQAIKNLLDICIEPHKALEVALEAGKNPEMLKAANNKQPEKQMKNDAPDKKPIAPNFG